MEAGDAARDNQAVSGKRALTQLPGSERFASGLTHLWRKGMLQVLSVGALRIAAWCESFGHVLVSRSGDRQWCPFP
jgi:hypothetical protein